MGRVRAVYAAADVLASAMSDQQTVSVFPIHESWLDIGRMDDFERAHEHLARSDT